MKLAWLEVGWGRGARLVLPILVWLSETGTNGWVKAVIGAEVAAAVVGLARALLGRSKNRDLSPRSSPLNRPLAE